MSISPIAPFFFVLYLFELGSIRIHTMLAEVPVGNAICPWPVSVHFTYLPYYLENRDITLGAHRLTSCLAPLSVSALAPNACTTHP
ncbi:hypothetical protein LZ30DRAFT_157536 [Colletotrichum cereale]|nr:hypothetical protein LZ30DRAFT_157536 [Colletotrichum cereale]